MAAEGEAEVRRVARAVLAAADPETMTGKSVRAAVAERVGAAAAGDPDFKRVVKEEVAAYLERHGAAAADDGARGASAPPAGEQLGGAGGGGGSGSPADGAAADGDADADAGGDAAAVQGDGGAADELAPVGGGAEGAATGTAGVDADAGGADVTEGSPAVGTGGGAAAGADEILEDAVKGELMDGGAHLEDDEDDASAEARLELARRTEQQQQGQQQGQGLGQPRRRKREGRYAHRVAAGDAAASAGEARVTDELRLIAASAGFPSNELCFAERSALAEWCKGRTTRVEITEARNAVLFADLTAANAGKALSYEDAYSVAMDKLAGSAVLGEPEVREELVQHLLAFLNQHCTVNNSISADEGRAGVIADWERRTPADSLGAKKIGAPQKALRSRLVVVVGAGAAGLAAARMLQRRGAACIVLEARGRVGGRIQTERGTFSAPVELGASLITGTAADIEKDTGYEKRPDPSTAFCKQAGLSMHTLPKGALPIFDARDGKQIDAAVDDVVFEAFNAVCDDLRAVADAATRRGAEDTSLEPALRTAWMRRRGATLVKVAKLMGKESQTRAKAEGDALAEAGGAMEVETPNGGASEAAEAAATGAAAVTKESAVAPGGVTIVAEGVVTDEVKDIVDRLFEWHLAHLEYGCSEKLGALSLHHWNDDEIFGAFGGEHCMIGGGWSTMAERMAEGLDIRHGKIVKEIAWVDGETSGGRAVSVLASRTGAGGNDEPEEILCDAVLVTVPLGVLKAGSIEFDPPLPRAKRNAIDKLCCGGLEKLVLEFPQSFWKDHPAFAGPMVSVVAEPEEGAGAEAAEAAKRTDGDGDSDDDADRGVEAFDGAPLTSSVAGRCFMFWNGELLHGKPILTTLLAGEAAHAALRPGGGEAAKEHALKVLRTIFSRETVPDPIAWHVTDWGSDPFAMGSYSSTGIGASYLDYDRLMAPLKKQVYFAGEHTCKEHPDTVGGAVLSGLREAARITANFLDALPDSAKSSANLCGGVTMDDFYASTKEQRERGVDTVHAVADGRGTDAAVTLDILAGNNESDKSVAEQVELKTLYKRAAGAHKSVERLEALHDLVCRGGMPKSAGVQLELARMLAVCLSARGKDAPLARPEVRTLVKDRHFVKAVARWLDKSIAYDSMAVAEKLVGLLYNIADAAHVACAEAKAERGLTDWLKLVEVAGAALADAKDAKVLKASATNALARWARTLEDVQVDFETADGYREDPEQLKRRQRAAEASRRARAELDAEVGAHVERDPRVIEALEKARLAEAAAAAAAAAADADAEEREERTAPIVLPTLVDFDGFVDPKNSKARKFRKASREVRDRLKEARRADAAEGAEGAAGAAPATEEERAARRAAKEERRRARDEARAARREEKREEKRARREGERREGKEGEGGDREEDNVGGGAEGEGGEGAAGDAGAGAPVSALAAGAGAAAGAVNVSSGVGELVRNYVRSVLRPHYKSKALSHRLYDELTDKAAAKVLAASAGAAEGADPAGAARYLTGRRKEKIRAVVDKLIENAAKRGAGGGGGAGGERARKKRKQA